MKHSTKTPTKAEAARMARLSGMGCICCRLRVVNQAMPTEVHHLLSGNKRRGHAFTIPLCKWHHKGEYPAPLHEPGMVFVFGPSLARQSKAFHTNFGTDDELLAHTNQILEKSHACGT